MTIQGLIDEINSIGFEATWDAEHSKLTINNTSLFDPGNTNLSSILNLSSTVAGKYIVSEALSSEKISLAINEGTKGYYTARFIGSVICAPTLIVVEPIMKFMYYIVRHKSYKRQVLYKLINSLPEY